MAEAAPQPAPDTVSRRRYERERRAREDAEALLEAKSRELFEANERLKRQAQLLEATVRERTAELERARVAAEAASEAKSTFLAAMSHEIRTPMNGLLGMAAALGETRLSPRQRGMLDVVMTSGNLLMTVINDILDFSKIEAGRLEIEEVPFKLGDMVSAVEAVHRLRAEEKGLRFVVTAEPEALGWFRGDPMRLRQILENLLSNAIKFTDRGQVDLSVEAGPGTDQGATPLTFVISDTGVGIAREKLGHLFQAFSQLDASTTRCHGGTGLGLSISRSLAALMGGAITVESTPGVGSRFTFTVGLGRTEHDDRALGGTAGGAAGGAETGEPPGLPRGLRILAAEDNRINQLVLCHLIAKIGADLTIAKTGREVLEIWSTTEPDLILMDIQMPELDGVDATREIRRRERALGRRPTPIVALTANALSRDVQSYLDAGMDGHVAKPVRWTDLERVLNEALSCGRARASNGADGTSRAVS